MSKEVLLMVLVFVTMNIGGVNVARAQASDASQSCSLPKDTCPNGFCFFCRVGNWSLCYDKSGYTCADLNGGGQCEEFQCSKGVQEWAALGFFFSLLTATLHLFAELSI